MGGIAPAERLNQFRQPRFERGLYTCSFLVAVWEGTNNVFRFVPLWMGFITRRVHSEEVLRIPNRLLHLIFIQSLETG